jgi:3-methyladenine DNA glycosylase AlkD
MLNKLIKELKSKENKKQAKLLQGFFKTGKGQYGEGDIFLGIKVPVQRSVAKKYNLELKDIQELLNSKIHEHRLCGLFVLINRYNQLKNSEKSKEEIFNFYIKNAKQVNNWDLVDLSSHKIVGDFLLNKPESEREILYKLAKSENLWKKRISIVSTFAFLRENDFKDALKLSEYFIKSKEKHDLIHKAVGWVLREIGKKDENILVDFLKKYYKDMPRTMLRYAIEKFPEVERKAWLYGEK